MHPNHDAPSSACACAGPLRWIAGESLTHLPEIAYRNRFAAALGNRSAPEIVRSYVYLSVAEMELLVRRAIAAVQCQPFRGTGLDAGAGCGLLGSLIAKHPAVDVVYAVEICEAMAELVIPKVASFVLGPDRNKVRAVWGSFDDIRLRDCSLDFIVEIDSFHHSHDLKRTLGECRRVLRPGGRLLCLDRCQPDAMSDEEVQRALARVYSREFLAANCYPPEIVLTRRDNGEHEYRLFEWREAMEGAGLRLVRVKKLHRAIPFRKALKGCLSALPVRMRRLIYQTDDAPPRACVEWLRQQPRWLPPIGDAPAPKDTTVLLAVKD